LDKYGLKDRINQAHIYGNLTDAYAAFQADQSVTDHA
jgi:hypothetical protein